MDGNKRAARIVMREFVARNGAMWVPSPAWAAEEADVIERPAARSLTEGALMTWVSKRIVP